MRYLVLVLLVFSFTACKEKPLTQEQKESVLLEEFEATKKLMGQSQFMSTDRTNIWIKEFTDKFQLDPKMVEKNGFKLNLVNAKAMQLATGNVISFSSTWELILIQDETGADGKINRKQFPARRSIVYLWEPAKNAMQAVLDTGFISVEPAKTN